MSDESPGPSPGERLLARTGHYAAFLLLFGVVYGGVVFANGGIPDAALFGILLASLLKDAYDEYRLRRGLGPLTYGGVEHASSNAVLLALLLGGYVDPTGAFAGVTARAWAVGLAAGDLLFDLSQDARA